MPQVVSALERRPAPVTRVQSTITSKKVLIINSYGGSLIVAARAAGAEIVGSYEDAGYGLKTQRRNFPELSYVDALPWPEEDLSGVGVIAHPPCAGFCAQNVNSAQRETTRGVDGAHFAKSRHVVEYALSQHARFLLLESVTGAYGPTNGFYRDEAARHGYRLFYILQNAATFGVPQWRPRFWVALVSADQLRDNRLRLRYEENRKTIGQLLDGMGEGERINRVDKTVEVQRQRLLTAGVAPSAVEDLLHGEKYGYGPLHRVLAKSGLVPRPDGHDAEWLRKYCPTTYVSMIPVVLDPAGYAPTLMCTSIWLYDGHPVSAEGYNRIMGFPDDYWFPQSEHLTLRSRGVCPPVASWLLRETFNNVNGAGDDANLAIEEGGTLDLRVAKDGKPAKVIPEAYRVTEVYDRRAGKVVAQRIERAGTGFRVARRLTATAVTLARRYAGMATHNALIFNLLVNVKKALTPQQVLSALIELDWETTSKAPLGIVRFHLDDLMKKGLVERGSDHHS